MQFSTMARSTRIRIGKLSMGVLAGAGVAFGLVSSVAAQTVVNPPSGAFTNGFPNADGSSNPFSNRGDGQASGVMDLMHRALNGQSKSTAEFSAEQETSLNDAAAQFRARQQELLQQRATTPVAPVAPSK